MKKEKITIDKILKKVPNKYKLAVACGQVARRKFIEGYPKHKIMNKVFEEILEDKIIIKEN